MLRFRPPVADPTPWTVLGPVPEATVDIAVVFEGLFAVTSAGELWYLHLRKPVEAAAWQRADRAPDPAGITGLNGLLYLADRQDGLYLRSPVPDRCGWRGAGSAGGARFLAGHAGRLIGGGPDGRLRWACPRESTDDLERN
jgi:hypothetical protein